MTLFFPLAMQIQSVFRASLPCRGACQTVRGSPGGSLLRALQSQAVPSRARAVEGTRGQPCPPQELMEPEAKPSSVPCFERRVQPCLAELLGTALFSFTGCLALLEDPGGTGRLQPALAHGLALAVTVAVLGDISGGHFNPAVSLAVCLLGGLHITMLIPYWLCQLCGGVIGAGLAKAVAPSERFGNASGGAFGGSAAGEQLPSVLGAEILLSSFLLLVVCMGAINGRTSTPLAPLCIGLTVTAGILAGGGVSGACMNPARAFGPALVANCWNYHWVYWVGPLVAALLVVGLVRLLLGDQATRLLLK